MAIDGAQPPILILIDLQQGLVDGSKTWGTRSTPDLEKNVTYLLQTWRSRNWPLIHIHHDDIKDITNPISARHPETFASHACSAPTGGEKVFVKHTSSALVNTPLADAIKELGGGRLVLCGMDSTNCVNSTVRTGNDLGFDQVVAADACATYGAADWREPGQGLDTETCHNVAMSFLTEFARVVPTKDVLQTLGAV